MQRETSMFALHPATMKHNQSLINQYYHQDCLVLRLSVETSFDGPDGACDQERPPQPDPAALNKDTNRWRESNVLWRWDIWQLFINHTLALTRTDTNKMCRMVIRVLFTDTIRTMLCWPFPLPPPLRCRASLPKYMTLLCPSMLTNNYPSLHCKLRSIVIELKYR